MIQNVDGIGQVVDSLVCRKQDHHCMIKACISISKACTYKSVQDENLAFV